MAPEKLRTSLGGGDGIGETKWPYDGSVSTWGGWSWLNLETRQKSLGLTAGLVSFE